MHSLPFSIRLARAAAVCVVALVVLPAALSAQEAPEAAALESIKWRAIGPANMGGRVSAIAGILGDRTTFYVGGADGGVFRTRNAGVTFDELFTDQPVYSVGALAIAASDRNVIWLGSGEGDPRNSASYGNGVYLSVDGGDTWKHLGLEDTERIKRIVVDPRDPDVAFVCALGHAWGPNEQRGVFRTSDGGLTWEKVLYIDEDTGCSDIAMDWSNPRILFAGMWTFRRLPWHFTDGGKETALYRSTDGGNTWKKLANGLPKGPMARIGVAIAQSDPMTVYMITEAKNEGTLFRSDDRGETWRMMNDDPNINFRPFYYSDIHVDPNDPNTIYSLSGRLSKSTDGGKTFERIANDVHGDHQAFWIDPMDSDRLLSGSDGGFQVSYDGGENFDIMRNVVLAQYYQIAVDDQDPYWVCGGLQDNGNWCGPSNSLHRRGILTDEWYTLNFGDGFYTEPVPGQPHLIYANAQGGMIVLTDTRTGMVRRIHPYPKIVGSAGDAIVDHRYRFNWDAPIHISPHDPATVYFGGNVVFRSRDFGYSWDLMSPDLTTNDDSKQLTSGGEVYTDNTAAEFHTSILTIAESPIEAGVIWVGTDDGNLQITRDGGATWTNVNRNLGGLPGFAWIAKIDASHHDAGTAYVAVDNHRSDDFNPYVYKTTDYGRSWTNLARGLPQDDYVKVVREDPRSPNLLYVGMERGIFASWDGGNAWVSIRNGLPPVSVRDIKVHPRENDLIIGTHGRGAYILDDLGPLQELGTAMASDTYLFPIRRGTRWQMTNKDSNHGQRTYRADNPPVGAFINYYVSEAPQSPLSIEISDASGQVIRTMEQKDVHAGVNRAVWDLRHQGAKPVTGEERAGGFFARIFGFGGGPRALPGTYTVTLEGEGWDRSGTVEVRGDPRVQMSTADYRAQFDALVALRQMTTEVNGAIDVTKTLTSQLSEIKKTVDQAGAMVDNDNGDLTARIDAAIDEVKTLSSDHLRRPPPRMNFRQKPRLSEEIFSLTFAIGGVEARPTEPQLLRVRELRDETNEALGALNRLLDTTIRELNEELGSYPRILVSRPVS